MFCKYCGKELADDVKFCSKCGKQLFHDSIGSETIKSKESVSTNEVAGTKSNNQQDKEKSVNTKRFCENCGESLVDGAKFCLACGSPVIASDLAGSVNQSSQSPVNRVSQFETQSNPTQYVPTESSKSRLAAALLAFFLGEFGAHRFYVEKKVSAIWQIILGFSFFIGLICIAFDSFAAGIVFLVIGLVWVVWILVDFIMILCGAFKDKDNLPLVNWKF